MGTRYVSATRHQDHVSPKPPWNRFSGAWLLAIPTEGLDLITQQAGALLIAAGERHRKGELELLQLVLTLDLRS